MRRWGVAHVVWSWGVGNVFFLDRCVFSCSLFVEVCECECMCAVFVECAGLLWGN